MTDAVNKTEQRLVESHLRNLRSVDRPRRLLADLKYGVRDEPISVTDWNPELALMQIIGAYQSADHPQIHSFAATAPSATTR